METLIVDFNGAKQGIATGLARHASGPIGVGDPILMWDGEEHRVRGVVTEITPSLIRAEIDWDTWETVERVVSLRESGGWWSAIETLTGQVVAAEYEFVSALAPEAQPITDAKAPFRDEVPA